MMVEVTGIEAKKADTSIETLDGAKKGKGKAQKELKGRELTVDEFLAELEKDAAQHYQRMCILLRKTDGILAKATR
jgi:hypothetical protein